MSGKRAASLGGLAFLTLAGGVAAALWASSPGDPQFGYDFDAYVEAARRLRLGLPLYPFAGAAAITPIGHGVFYYPPWVALLFLPFEALPRDVATLAWFGILTLAALALIVLIAGEHDPTKRPWVIGAAIVFLPLISELRYGNLNLVSILLVLAAWRMRARTLPAGAVLGLAIGLKLLPLVVLVFLIAASRWRMAGAALLTMGAVVVVTLPWLGQAWADYISVLRGLGQGIPAQENAIPQALGAFPWRYLLPALAVIVAALTGWWAKRAPATESMSFKVALAAAPLLATSIWYTYFVAALPLLLAPTLTGTSGAALAPGRIRDYLVRGLAWAVMQAPLTAVPLAGLGVIIATTGVQLSAVRPSADEAPNPGGPPRSAPPILAAR